MLLNCEKNEHCLSLGRISWVWLIYSKVVEYTMQGWSHGGRRLQNGITTSEVVLPWFNPPPLQPNAEYQCSKSPASWRSLPIWLPILICNPHYGEIPLGGFLESTTIGKALSAVPLASLGYNVPHPQTRAWLRPWHLVHGGGLKTNYVAFRDAITYPNIHDLLSNIYDLLSILDRTILPHNFHTPQL